MKKISTLSVFALAGLCAFGQASVVKQAEDAQKKGTYFEEVVSIITPALSNPETAQQAATYMVPGKAGFATYDKMYELNALGQLPANGEKIRANALLGGYDYMMKALPFDSVPDAKGKVKPKYSKDIVKAIGGHYNDYNIVAIDFWNLQDWDNAYRAWDIYCKLPNDERFVKAIPVVPADSTIAEIMFNRSLAAFQTGDMEKTYKSFLEAKDKGYNKKSLYDYALAAAFQAGNEEVVEQLCLEAIPLYGAEDSRYIGQLINGYLEKKDYAGALNKIDQALATDPNNAQYYVIRGIIYEREGKGDPKAEFKKAMDLDSQNAQAVYNYGRMVFNEGVRANDEAPTDPTEYAKVKATTVDPIMKEAAKYLEDAYNLDPENGADSLNILGEIYYLLGDENMMNDVNKRKAL